MPLPVIAQLVERSTVDRLVGCSIHPRRRSDKRRAIFYFVVYKSTFGVVVTFLPSKEEPRFRLPEGALKKGVVAQMVERALCLREEGGSPPLNSILKFLSLINSKTYLRHLEYILYND